MQSRTKMNEDDESIVLHDFSVVIVAIERSSRYLKFNSSAASEITFDSSSRHDESLSSEDEDESEYADYHRTLAGANRTKAIRPHEPSKVTSENPLLPKLRSKCRRWRLNRGQLSRALAEPLNLSCQPPTVPKRMPFLEDSFATQQTASMNSLGSEGLHWLVVGKEWTGTDNKKKDRALALPKRMDSMEAEHPRAGRAGKRPEGKSQPSFTSADSFKREGSSSLVEI